MTSTTVAVAISLLSIPLSWFLNEKSKRVYEEYKRKEQRYAELIKSINGFYVDSHDSRQVNEFINQLHLCWMYCPDVVIKKGYAFLNTVHSGEKCAEAEKEEALGDFVLAIREDLLHRKPTKTTQLTAKDFKLLRAN